MKKLSLPLALVFFVMMALPVFADDYVVSTATITRPADTTAYTIGDAVADSVTATGGSTFANVNVRAGGGGQAVDLVITSNNPAGTPLQGELIVFDSAITNTADNAALALTPTDVKKVVAMIPFTLVTRGTASLAHVTGATATWDYAVPSGRNLRFVVRATNAYQPISGEVFTFKLKVSRSDQP